MKARFSLKMLSGIAQFHDSYIYRKHVFSRIKSYIKAEKSCFLLRNQTTLFLLLDSSSDLLKFSSFLRYLTTASLKLLTSLNLELKLKFVYWIIILYIDTPFLVLWINHLFHFICLVRLTSNFRAYRRPCR